MAAAVPGARPTAGPVCAADRLVAALLLGRRDGCLLGRKAAKPPRPHLSSPALASYGWRSLFNGEQHHTQRVLGLVVHRQKQKCFRYPFHPSV